MQLKSSVLWDVALPHWAIDAQHVKTAICFHLNGHFSTDHPLMQHHILEQEMLQYCDF
jgi:hypothetical protein